MKVDGGGKRDNKDKLRMELVPMSAMRAIARVFGFGATKYEEHNWRRGMKWSTVVGCLQRHMADFIDGKDKDPESGLDVLDHIIANVAMLIEYRESCPELDDRFKSENKVYSKFKQVKPKTLYIKAREGDWQTRKNS